MNGSVPPENSKQIYGAELSLHTEIVPERIKNVQVTLNKQICFKEQKSRHVVNLFLPQ
jgi:hypothetical protein